MRQVRRQKELQLTTRLEDQSILGLCCFNQIWPSTKGLWGDMITKRDNDSRWFPEMTTLKSSVTCVMLARSLPLRSCTVTGGSLGKVDIPA